MTSVVLSLLFELGSVSLVGIFPHSLVFMVHFLFYRLSLEINRKIYCIWEMSIHKGYIESYHPARAILILFIQYGYLYPWLS